MLIYLIDVPEADAGYDIRESGQTLDPALYPTPEIAALVFAVSYAKKYLDVEATLGVRVVCLDAGGATKKDDLATLNLTVRVYRGEASMCARRVHGWRAELVNAPAAPSRPAEPSDIWPTDALVYCKPCHKTHAAQAGEKMCGGPGSWVAE